MNNIYFLEREREREKDKTFIIFPSKRFSSNFDKELLNFNQNIHFDYFCSICYLKIVLSPIPNTF